MIYKEDDIRHILCIVESEVECACSKHKSMNSAHEGYAVILEELDELWEEIKKKHPEKSRLKEEAIQVAAMAVRFVIDVCEKMEEE